MTYQDSIYQDDPTINPAGVEASMRLQYGTLSHLTRGDFLTEIQIAKDCEAYQPGYLKSVAESFGMADDFAHWERVMAQGGAA